MEATGVAPRATRGAEGHGASGGGGEGEAKAGANGPKQEFLFKIIVIGEASVGKTSTIKRYVDDVYSTGYKATIGVDFALRMIELDDKTLVRLQLWDIAGQERFGSMTRVYYRDADAAIIMFDLTSRRTFDSVAKWKADVDEKVLLPNGEPVPCLLLGNKSDLPGRVIETEAIEAFCKQEGFIGFHAVSAKTSDHVDEAMLHLLRYLLSTSTPEAPEETDAFRLGDEEPAASERKCCE